MQITSPKNPILQDVRRAALSGRLTDRGLVVAEGPHLVEEAHRSRWPIERLFVSSSRRQGYADLLSRIDTDLIEVSDRAFAAAADTETNQGLLALLRPKEYSWDDLVSRGSLLVVLDGIQDPGNAGTIIRSAEAFGASGAVFIKGSVRVSNGKFLRSTAGSILRLPFIENAAVSDLLGWTKEREFEVYALSGSGNTWLSDVNLQGKCALVVGSEGCGVSPEVLKVSVSVRIPTGKVESLNAGVACSIALFEAARQRGFQ